MNNNEYGCVMEVVYWQFYGLIDDQGLMLIVADLRPQGQLLECAMRFRKGTMIEKCHAYAKSDKSSNKRKEKSNRYATLLFDGR